MTLMSRLFLVEESYTGSGKSDSRTNDSKESVLLSESNTYSILHSVLLFLPCKIYETCINDAHNDFCQIPISTAEQYSVSLLKYLYGTVNYKGTATICGISIISNCILCGFCIVPYLPKRVP